MDAVDLSLAHGQILGLLGVNGAGKSTTLAMLAGVLAPDSGNIFLNGEPLAGHTPRIRQLLGWLPERVPLWPELTVAEHLQHHAQLRGLRGKAARSAVDAVCQRLELGSLRRRLTGALSQGQRQRLGLAAALVHNPPLLILDEPGNALDPVQTVQLRQLLREHADAGGAVVLSTHLLPEVTAVCDRAAILHEGTLQHDAPLAAGDAQHLQVTLGAATDAGALRALPAVAAVQSHAERRFSITLAAGSNTPDLVRALLDSGHQPLSVTPGHGNLEQVFLDIATREHAA